MNSKRLFIIVEMILAAMVIVLAMIMFREQVEKDRYRVSVILPDTDSSQWSAFRYGLKMAAEDQGIEMFVVSTGDMLTFEEELSMIQDEIRNGAKAVIVRPVSGNGDRQKLKEISKKIPIILVGNTVSEDEKESRFSVIGLDDYAMGKALAKEVLKDFNENIEGKALGVVAQDIESAETVSRQKGFLDTLRGKGSRISWMVSSVPGESNQNLLKNQSKTDLVIALDDFSLKQAGECSVAKDLHGALIYGIGNSTEAVYYLDTGITECLLVPDEFNRGYESMTEAAKRVEHFLYKTENKNLPFTIIRKKELFTKKNQEIIFTMSQ